MSIWFFVWLVLSLALLAFVIWTAFIIYRQKQAWKAYAAKHSLRYKENRFYDSPEMEGIMGNYTVSFFTGEHPSTDVRRTRKLTAIEIQLSSMLPVEGGVASGGLVDFIRNFKYKDESRINHPRWEKSYIAVSEQKNILENYLTPPRLEAVLDLMEVEHAWFILIFRGDIALLRIDVPEPLDSDDVIDGIVSKMLKAAEVLELDEAEIRRLKSEKARKPEKEVEIKVEDDLDVSGLQLEEDDE